MHRIFSAAPNLDLTGVSVEADKSSAPARQVEPLVSIRRLSAHNSDSAIALLLQPEFVPYTRSLKNLFIPLYSTTALAVLSPLCLAAAETLECIQFNDPSCDDWAVIREPQLGFHLPPRLPRLGHLSLTIDHWCRYAEDFYPLWLFSDILLSGLSPSTTPVLTHLAIHLILHVGYGTEDSAEVLMQALDNAFVCHPTLATVHWSYRVAPAPLGAREEKRLCLAFYEILRNALPQASAKGLLEFES
ncbi:hypothetical protein C8F01DRAFT_516567 [Mycena amicta]|nr:hypothetical protein C8F01DRAFT_516567 [Mycena amicta]